MLRLEKIFGPEKFLVLENFWSWKILVPKIIWILKHFGFQKNVGSLSIFHPKKFFIPKNFSSQKIFHPKNCQVLKTFWALTNFGSQKVLCCIGCVLQKILCSMIFLIPKNVWSLERLGPEKFGSGKMSVPKKCWVSSNDGS